MNRADLHVALVSFAIASAIITGSFVPLGGALWAAFGPIFDVDIRGAVEGTVAFAGCAALFLATRSAEQPAPAPWSKGLVIASLSACAMLTTGL